ncbi:MAG: SirB2 family protein [Bacteroidetes bacterium]|nr:SirB2 family protein [Bacteroidota bacterium]
MFKAIFYTHLVAVNLFLLIYLVKTILLVANKNEALAKFTKINKVPEMIISTLFLLSGIYLLTQIGTTTLLIIKIVIVMLSIPVAIIGFKKSNKVLAVLSLVMIIAAYGLAEMNKKKIDKQTVDASVANTEDANYDAVKHGESVYTAYCQSCHGAGGANGAGGLDLTVTQTDHVTKLERIKNGASSMPGFKDVLNEKEIEAVTAYVESLKK